mgnify:CR=1 FL=1|jgi:hypothetical protein
MTAVLTTGPLSFAQSDRRDDGSADFVGASDVIEADLSKCNVWNNAYNAKDSCIYWIGDDNDEIVNLYRSNLSKPDRQRLTDVPYTYECGFNPDCTKIAYVSRMGQSENRLD